MDWFESYLSGRTMYVRYNGCTSNIIILNCGVPQGSMLGPVVFILYYADVIKIASKHSFKAHSYADDVQLYDHAVANSCATLFPRMSACVLKINDGEQPFKVESGENWNHLVLISTQTQALFHGWTLSRWCDAAAVPASSRSGCSGWRRSVYVNTHQPLDQDMFLPHSPATYCAQVTHCGH